MIRTNAYQWLLRLVIVIPTVIMLKFKIIEKKNWKPRVTRKQEIRNCIEQLWNYGIIYLA